MRGGWILTFMTGPSRHIRCPPAEAGAHNHQTSSMGPRFRGDDRWRGLKIYNLHSPIVTGPPAASTASLASAKLATCSTVGFLSLGTSPFSMLFSIDHAVRSGSNPPLTDHTQFLVKTSIA